MKTFSILRQIFIFVTLTLCCITLHAQTVSNEFKNTINNAFAGLDLNRVPHHLLTDYAMEFVNLESYNGVLTANNYVHKGIYTAGYNTLLMARTKQNIDGLIHPNQFHANWEAARQSYTIALSGFYYKYSQLRKNAHPNAITITNNKLYDKYINGVWQNPYETANVFMMSAPTVVYNYKNMNVVLPANLWYTNQNAQVESIAVNFNDGNGFKTITMGQQYYLEYSEEGTYDWEYRLTLTNGTILKSRSKIIIGNEIAPITIGIPLKRLITEPCVPRFQPNTTYVNGTDQIEFQGTTLFGGIANSAIIQIDYANGSNGCPGITRPLIVAEGFESGLLGGENPLGENSLRNFRNNARDASLDLRGEIDQYDIIYINWNQGRDDLRRNAALLQDIITWVNEQKELSGSTNPNVVLGQSMGGIIARYTLATMEQDNDANTNHDTSLYISHDAPHQGANIPLSIQYFARHLADQFVSTPLGDMDLPAAQGSITLDQINEVFNSTGTKQLLANNISSSFSLNNTDFENWQVELQNLGYPQQTRNIAISNASHCANDQLLSAQDELLFLSGNFGPTVFGDFLINNVPLLNGVTRLAESALYVYLAFTLNNPAYLAGLLPGRTNFNLRFDAKALPAVGQTANIYKGRIRITKKINFLLFDLTYNINITNKEYNNPSQVRLPLDSYPGGFYPVTFSLSDANASQSNWFFQLNVTGRNADSFNFIPTPSALDVGSGSSTLFDNDYKERYNAEMPPVGSRAIPFDNFTTSFDLSGNNEAHISFNTRNGDWLALELNNIQDDEELFDCTAVCDIEDWEISGPDTFCDNATFTLPAGLNDYNWSFPGVVSVPNPLQPNVVDIQAWNDGYRTLSANINLPRCGYTRTISKTIYVGKPLPGGNIQELGEGFAALGIYPSNTYCDEVAFRLTNIPHFEQVDDIEWELVSGSSQWDGPMRNGLRIPEVVFYPECNETVTFRARYGNECGYSDWTEFTVDLDVCDNDCNNIPQTGSIISNNFVISPVPANDYLAIDMVPNPTWTFYTIDCSDGLTIDSLNRRVFDIGNTTNCPTYVSVQLYNFTTGNPGMPVLNIPSHPLGSAINVSGLPSGNYIMHVSHGGQLEVHHIPIQ